MQNLGQHSGVLSDDNKPNVTALMSFAMEKMPMPISAYAPFTQPRKDILSFECSYCGEPSDYLKKYVTLGDLVLW